MRVELRDLKPNPFRDFTVDPIDDDNIKALTDSIKQDGFWGGIVCRKTNQSIEIGAGHHRVRAALKAGITVADIFVGDLDDAAMIRVYARENATQRGNSSTAIAGSIASAIRFIAKAVMSGSHVSQIWETSKTLETLQGQLSGDRGLGEPIITGFLANIPGINKATVTAQLANLKASGDYQRIVGEVSAEIEKENREAIKELERLEQERKAAEERERKANEERRAAIVRAKQAKEDADKRRAREAEKIAEANAQLAEKRKKEMDAELKKFDALRTTRDTAQKAANNVAAHVPTFDFEGVAKHFKNENQVRVFREVVTGQGIAPILPVNQQANLAAALVQKVTENNEELSGAFIRNNAGEMARQFKSVQRKHSKEELEAAAREDIRLRLKQHIEDFARACRSLTSTGLKITELIKNHRGIDLAVSTSFREDIRTAKKIIDTLSGRI